MSLRHCIEKVACGATRAVFACLAAFCISLAICIIAGTVFTFFHTVFPLIIDLESAFGHLNFILAAWLSFNLVFNYVMVLRTGPGHSDPSCLTRAELSFAQAQKYDYMDHDYDRGRGFALWCRHSDLPKPPRAHYCHVSGALVLKMDHFCPWIGQCVGHYNHRYFVLFLCYLWCSTGYAVVTVGLHWNGLLENPKASPAVLSASQGTFNMCFMVCLALTVVISGFLGWSGFLAVTNQTTIEFLFNRQRAREARMAGFTYRNPFDLGLRHNLQQIFGPVKHLWQIFLPSLRPLDCDGHHWPMVDNPTGSWTGNAQAEV